MKRTLVAVALLAMGVLAVGQCPTVGLPVTRVDQTVSNGYLVWVQNTAKCSYTEFSIVFQVPVAALRAVTINGTQVASVTGEGAVWKVTLQGAGLRPNGFLLLSLTGVNPVVPAACKDLVRAVFPAPLCR